MSFSESQIKVQEIQDLGLVAGIIDEMSLVDLFNQTHFINKSSAQAKRSKQ
ncbi:hypothetical protein RintRC_2554 [Richelia intracellularis]|nr:hypothetical protein RintRC_2554 [Richelia intracellularis]